jgi:hypothetical protein
VFAGTEWGLYASLDGGNSGRRSSRDPERGGPRPAIQPREGDLLVATHGRGIYVLDDLSPLQLAHARAS